MSDELLDRVLERWPDGVDVVPAGGLDRHELSTRRAVAIRTGGPIDRSLLERHYPSEAVADAISQAERYIVLPPRDPQADLASVAALARIAERLRAPGGCPWDREQTHATLRPLLLEETYEAMDAIDSGDAAALREELGDLLFHVVIHAQLATEAGTFDLAAVARSAGEKLVRRHPHVFAGTELAGDLLEQWERIKREERVEKGTPDQSILDGIPASMPALYAAERMLERAARIGISPARIDLPLDVDDAEALGELLFDLAALAREQGLEAEDTLRAANLRFRARVRLVEERARTAGRDLASYSAAEMRDIWEGLS